MEAVLKYVLTLWEVTSAAALLGLPLVHEHALVSVLYCGII